ncbi:MAG: hypothetical protein ACYCYC_06205 [Bellilinea sp.]
MLFESLVSHHERFAAGDNSEIQAGFDAHIIDVPASEQYVTQGIAALLVVADGNVPLGVKINDKDAVSTLGKVVRQGDIKTKPRESVTRAATCVCNYLQMTTQIDNAYRFFPMHAPQGYMRGEHFAAISALFSPPGSTPPVW